MLHKIPVRLSPMRTVTGQLNVFARESVIDELAEKAGIDPLEYRLNLLDDDESKEVLQKTADMADWSNKGQRALGLAFSNCDGVKACVIIEVRIDAKGEVHVPNLWVTAACGQLILPYNAEAQVEGATLFALSNVLYERITMKNGAVEQSNFDNYRVMRLKESPDVHIAFIKSNRDPAGLGDIVSMPVGAATANAIYAASQQRVRHMPFLPERVLPQD